MMGGRNRQSIGEQDGKNRKCTNGEHEHRKPQVLVFGRSRKSVEGAMENEVEGQVGGKFLKSGATSSSGPDSQ